MHGATEGSGSRASMKTGRSKYLTKQAGEYLVAAELSRRGYIATTFTGNVPDYDIIAVDDSGGVDLIPGRLRYGRTYRGVGVEDLPQRQTVIRPPPTDP